MDRFAYRLGRLERRLAAVASSSERRLAAVAPSSRLAPDILTRA